MAWREQVISRACNSLYRPYKTAYNPTFSAFPVHNKSRPTFARGIIPFRGSGNGTYTRASTKYQIDHEGKYNLLLSGEEGERGSRRVENLITGSSRNLTGGSWSVLGTVTRTYAVTAPDGSATATRLAATGAFGGVRNVATSLSKTGAKITWSLYVRLQAGTPGAADITVDINDATATNIGSIVTTEWSRVAEVNVTPGSGGANVYIDIVAVGGITIDVWEVLTENVVGQANINPSEPVSVGVLSAPFHGANVDGVKYFDTLNGNTVASNVVTEATGAKISSATAKFAVLPGVSGSYFSTPDSVANSITGDIDIRVFFSVTDSTGFRTLIAKTQAGTLTRAFGLYLNNLTPFVQISLDGSTIDINTGATTGIAVGTTGLRFTRNATTGTLNFYTLSSASMDSQTWVALGDPVSASPGAMYDPANRALTIGAQGNSGNANLLYGKIYRAQIYNGIDGTLAVDFNPNLSSSAQTFTAATGEVWTTNGGARIYGNTHATYGIPAQWDASGPFGYPAEGARADVLGATAAIRRTMADVGWVVGATTTVGSATGADGVASAAASLTFGAVEATNTILFTTVLGSAQRTYSAQVRRKTGTGAVYMTDNGGTNWTEITSLLNTSTYALVQVTRTQANPVVGFKGATNTDAIEVDFNTIEAASFANPTPIPVNVSKAADVLTHPASGNASQMPLTVYAEYAPTNTQSNGGDVVVMIHDGTGNNRMLVYMLAASTRALVTTGGVGQADVNVGAITQGAVNKLAGLFAADRVNIFKDGTGGTEDTSATSPGAMTTISIGAQDAGLAQPFGTIRNVDIFRTKRTSAYMINRTAASCKWRLSA